MPLTELYEAVRPLLIVPHALLGTLVLLSGVVAFATEKGGRTHMQAGLCFHWALLGNLAMALPLMILKGNTFLLLLSPLSAYLVIAGRRAVLRRRAGSPLLSTFDRGLAVALLLGSVALLAFATMLFADGSGFAPVAAIFGALGARMAWGDWKRRDDASPHPKQWLRDHIGLMGGGFIAGVTAFSSINLQDSELPVFVIWLWPSVLIVPLIVWFTRRDAG